MLASVLYLMNAGTAQQPRRSQLQESESELNWFKCEVGPIVIMYKNLLGLKFLFQKHILLHYLPRESSFILFGQLFFQCTNTRGCCSTE